jgi:rhodanese-related sulfurtransferase
MNEISAVDAAALLAQESENTVLLDVRELMELEMAAVAGALHIPMAEVPARLQEVDQNKTIICMCHAGGRSAQVAGYMAGQGYTDVKNLSGGIDAWSTSVDGSIPRY